MSQLHKDLIPGYGGELIDANREGGLVAFVRLSLQTSIYPCFSSFAFGGVITMVSDVSTRACSVSPTMPRTQWQWALGKAFEYIESHETMIGSCAITW